MEVLGQRHKPRLVVDIADVRRWIAAYRAADSLHHYMFERWRNELDLYQSAAPPKLAGKFEIVWVNA